MHDFHEIRFPLDIAVGSRGGPQRRTDIVTLASGREARNSRWASSRRRYDAGYGIKSLAALNLLLAFFEERRGRLYGFRWHDRADDRSCAPGMAPGILDQFIATGDGGTSSFQLVKTYGVSFAPYHRAISKPVDGSVRVAVDGVEQVPGSAWALDPAAGTIAFMSGQAPAAGAAITAGFLFDVPVRFDTDYLEIDHAAFAAGEIPYIPIVEIIP